MSRLILIFATLGLCLTAAPVWSEQPEPAIIPAQAAAPFDAPVSDADLAQYRGGHIETNTNNLDGQFYNNQAMANVTGSNFVTGSAFAGASGLSTIIQNSGNNVLIQNATILNLRVQ